MKLNTKYIILYVSLLSSSIFGQTNPATQAVPYSQDFSALAATSTTYPAGWQGWQLSTGGPLGSLVYRTTAPTADIALTASGTALSATGGVYNYNGKIGFLQSGSSDPAICLALNTTGLTGTTVTYDVMTIRNPYDGSTNTRINEVTLQYRVGTSGAFTTLPGITYQNNTTTQITAVTTPQNSQTKTVMLPASCDNQAVVQIRWTARDVSGGGSRASFAFDNISVSSCSTNTSTYYYRSFTSGNWNTASTWEASLTGASGWITACTPPTNAAAGITIQSGHTVTIDVNSTAPDLTVNSGGTLISNNTAFVSLTISGNLVNNGTFQMVNGSFGVNVIFNKNGNQSVTGTGSTTNFYSIGLNLGTSSANILDIGSANFSGVSPLLSANPKTSTTANTLLNGTLKLSGTYTYTGTLLHAGTTSFSIPATAGIWINNSNVTISGSNDSYDVSGTLRISAGTFNAGTAVGNAIRLLNGSSMIVDGGTVNVSGRIQAYNSAGTVAQSATYTQSGGTVILSVAGQNTSTMPEFTMDTPANLVMSGGTIIFRNQAASSDDLYNKAISTITGGIIQIADANTTVATPAGYLIESPSALPSLVIYKPTAYNPKVILGDNLSIIGNITINTGTTLDNQYASGTNYNISLTGNWNNDNVFAHHNLQTVTFNGASAQNITGATATAFNNLTINNSSGGVTLLSPASVNSLLTLTNGYLYTSAADLLSLNAVSSVTGANNNSFVYGPMSKTGATDFTFPVGKDLEYRPISATSLTGSETFTAEYFHTDPDPLYSRYSKDPTLDHLDGCEYWILNRAGAVNANVTLSWDTYSCGVTSLPDLAVARWDSSLGMWKDHGNGGTTGTTATGTIITSGLVTSFSPFTLASHLAAENPLPIELVNFNANYNGENAVNLKWTTASEINNNYFTVERSSDAVSFTELKQIPGAGNSTAAINYRSIDDSPLKGISYYRLKQTDFNGEYKYSTVASVVIDLPGFEIVNTFENDNENTLDVTLNSNQNELLNIQLLDMTGKKVYDSSQHISGDHSKLQIPIGELSKGIYLFRVFNGTTSISKKIRL